MKERNYLLVAAGKILAPITRYCSIWRLILAYLSTSHAPHRTLPTRYSRAKLKVLARLLGDFHQVKMVEIRKLQFSKSEAFGTFVDAQPLSLATCRYLKSAYLSLIRFAVKRGIIHDAIEQPAHNQKPVRKKVDLGGDGTLWEICQRYFAVNVRIRHEHTRSQYRIALKDFAEFLGRPGLPADLHDDNVAGMQKMLLARGCAPKTANERRGRINALWTWMAKRKLVEVFPTNYKVREPRRLPEAWNADQLAAIFRSCQQEKGTVAGLPAADWWLCLHWLAWDSGERISALLAVEWESIDWRAGTLFVRAEIRKGQSADMLYVLAPDTLLALSAINRGVGPILPWDKTGCSLYNHYRRILRRAGLPAKRRDMFHKLRKSVVSHLEAIGVNSTPIVGHASRDVTVRSYIDPKIARTQSPADVLFRPLPSPDVVEGSVAGLIEGPAQIGGAP